MSDVRALKDDVFAGLDDEQKVSGTGCAAAPVVVRRAAIRRRHGG